MPRRPVTPKTGNFYAVSDLHIHPRTDDGLFARLFTDKKAQVLTMLAQDAASTKARGGLLLLGDTFDLTGMRAPANGLQAFFTAVLGPDHGMEIPVPEPVVDYLDRLGASYPDLFKALGKVATRADLVMVLGNHDHALFTKAAMERFAKLLGVLPEEIKFVREQYRAGPYLFVHGHQFDPSNATLDDHPNRGAIIASALYHALMPALLKLGVDADIVAAIPAVRPEEEIVTGLPRYLKPEQTDTLLRAFVKLLFDNDYWPHVPQFVTDFIAGSVATPERVRQEMASDRAMGEVLRRQAHALLRSQDGFGASVAVMGHTHDQDTELLNYVNLGTWIDAVAGLSQEALQSARCELPVLRIAPDATAKLFDARKLPKTEDLEACKELWCWPSMRKPVEVPWSFDLLEPTVTDQDRQGYSYVETSPAWKESCQVLPCFAAIQWPDYDTKIVEETIDGEPVVFQLWKGWCEQFLFSDRFPGGVGAEVGIYRRVPGRKVPGNLPPMPASMRRALDAAAAAGGNDLWWPYPELGTLVEFKLVNPQNGQVLFYAPPQKTYWRNRWMSLGSYSTYKGRGGAPRAATGWRLEYSVNGKQHAW